MRAPALEALGGATSLVLLGAIALAPTSALPHFPCPLRALTSIPCVTCGGTRAILALRDGDLVGALVMNPLVVLAIFAALAFATYAAAVLVLGVPPWRPELRRGAGLWALRVGVPVALAANWIYLVAAGR
ncbi:DUF2752 domain-containing protein [Myxococcota bacterium]|nr:DUF2752 domain-containing protein [Myxococcota bacterium]